MRLFFLFQICAVFASAYASGITIAPESDISAPGLKIKLERAATRFSEITGQPAPPLAAKIETSGCLRTGYNFQNSTLVFCKPAAMINAGLDSDDIINHEAFHAMLCARIPSSCSREMTEDTESLHEGLADYFAYAIIPDQCFGENAYSGTPCMRHYLNHLCYSLSAGAHLKGNAITALLIRHKSGDRMIKTSVDRGELSMRILRETVRTDDTCFSENNAPSLSFSPSGGIPPSPLNRYRIVRGTALTLVEQPNTAFEVKYPGNSIKWTAEDGTPLEKFAIDRAGGNNIVAPKNGAQGFEKALAAIIDEDGEEIGLSAFYFTVRDSQ